jgi:putative hydrolase of the HAD superfamily
MSHTRQPEALLLDLGDTLIEPTSYRIEPGVEALLSVATYRNGATVESVSELARTLNLEFGRRANDSLLEYSQRVFQRMLYDSFGVAFDRSELELERMYWDAALEFVPEPGAAEALDAARELGLTLGVISNSSFTGPVLSHELAKQGLDGNLEFVLSTADYGLRKPHPQIFRVGLQKAGVDPSRAWYVGNSLEFDVEGALEVGMVPVWYNRVGQETVPPAGTYTIAHWSELPPLLSAAIG